ncbi:MAG: hypothetical protein IJC43_06350 [Clostridia bacterium]|nr:hypothetical protein [Clostridia bacterium]
MADNNGRMSAAERLAARGQLGSAQPMSAAERMLARQMQAADAATEDVAAKYQTEAERQATAAARTTLPDIGTGAARRTASERMLELQLRKVDTFVDDIASRYETDEEHQTRAQQQVGGHASHSASERVAPAIERPKDELVDDIAARYQDK